MVIVVQFGYLRSMVVAGHVDWVDFEMLVVGTVWSGVYIFLGSYHVEMIKASLSRDESMKR